MTPATPAVPAKEAPARRANRMSGDAPEFFSNRFVYSQISARARGLCIGVNMNPDKHCNFDCAYCDVNRSHPPAEPLLDVDLMAGELSEMLALARDGGLQNFYGYRNVSPDLMRLRQVELSGDGEPTSCPNFLEVVQAVTHLRAIGKFPFFKIALLTNAAGLDLRDVQAALSLFTPHDEIWAKLDAGTQCHMDFVNQPHCSLEKILQNILQTARRQPVVIQSLFPLLNNGEPSPDEIEQYALRLCDLKDAGAKIQRVQIYSASHSPARPECAHLPLKSLSAIGRMVRHITGLKVEVY